ncbi:hypothetical protein [Actinomadura madurae]|uniref:hypothetical protein n=1 Tax=Actinomadura madurae TaxID=1993 RepID=UPI0020D1FBD6|nr:hypothetical protein [Actinomadura madurae]MCQ0013453.1 hypothetical protein [Actinomadura madurae]
MARHLVMAGRLAEEEPELSYRHAKAARRLASRVGIVREAAGIAAYHAGEWAEALAELRAARRAGRRRRRLPAVDGRLRARPRPSRAGPRPHQVTGGREARPDGTRRAAHRGVGRPPRPRAVRRGRRHAADPRAARPPAAAVVDAAVLRLRGRARRGGPRGEAADWFARAAAADRDGDTDAAERYAEIEGLHILDTEEDGEAQTGEAQADAEQAGGDQGAEPGEVSATDIAFKPAEPEVQDAPDEDAPEAAAVFLEPKPAGEEQPPPAE